MIPVLYPWNETEFDTNNGFGLLTDAITCKCSEALNSTYELELTIPVQSCHADEIETDCILKVKPNYEDDPQPFRIFSVETKLDGILTVKAAHLSYDTAGIPVLPFTVDNLTDAVDNLNSNRYMSKGSYFVLVNDFSADGDFKIDKPMSFRELLGGGDNTIIKVYGGDYHYDNYLIELLSHRGIDKGVCFRQRKNIIDFEQEINSEKVYSAAVGFWKKAGSDGNPDVFVYSDVINVSDSLPYEKILIVDVTEKFESKPSKSDLNEYMTQYALDEKIGIQKYSMSITYVEDDNIVKVCVGDTVGVILSDFGIRAKARCTKVVYDCLLERNESIEIGVTDNGIVDELAGLKSSNEN